MVDYYSCIKLMYPEILDSEFLLVEDETGLSISWFREDPKPTFEQLDLLWLGIVKKQALADIKDIRRITLDKAAISSGILAIYDTNYVAAVEFLAGRTTTIIKNGMTALDYLTGFGSKLQMTAHQFASYIIAENYRVGPSVYDVEKRYLALTYAGDININMLTTVDSVLQAVSDFKEYCNA